MHQKVKRNRSVVNVKLTFDDGDTVIQMRAKLEVRTAVFRIRTCTGRVEAMDGLRQRIVTLPRPLRLSQVGKTALMTLSTGDSWRVLPKDPRTLVQTV